LGTLFADRTLDNVADPGDVHWRSISRDNILTLYGRDISSRIADPANPKNIFSWLVCEIRDDKGNGIVYDYVAENSDNIDRSPNERNRVRTANRYLKRIRYGNRRSLLDEQGRRPHFVSPEQFERADWMFEVVLDYEEHHVEELVFLADELPAEQHDKVQATATAARSWAARPDPFSSYRSGFEVRTYRRCHRFLMFHRFEELGPEPYLVRSTELDYADLDVSVDPSVEAELTHQGSTRFASFVHSIAQCGYLRDEIQPPIELNGARYFTYLQRSLPAVVFEYSKPRQR
jgi:hypothetical protein